MSFLKQLAELIYANHPENPGNVWIITPNKRAGLYLREYLSAYYKKPVWSPTILSIEDFFCKLADVRLAGKLEQLFLFYQAYCKVEKDHAEKIDSFLSWGQKLLNDFNELDQHLTDMDAFFTYLNADRALENWNPEQTELSSLQKKYIEFWEKFPLYYAAFHKILKEQEKTYSGMAYRMVAENVRQKEWQEQVLKDVSCIYFAGFNALTKAEEEVLDVLTTCDKACVVWDTDPYFTEDKNQEAGMFLRENIKRFKAERSFVFNGNLQSGEKNISIISIAGNASQAAYAASLLGNMDLENPKDTAIILADETMLLSFLENIPEKVSSINVTMGYPLKHTNVASFFRQLVQMHVNAGKAYASDKKMGFYYKDVLSLLAHPYMRAHFFEERNTLEKYILENNCVHLSEKELKKDASLKELSFLFTHTNSPVSLIALCISIASQLKEKIASTESEELFHISSLFTEFETFIQQFDVIDSLPTFQRLFEQLILSDTIPFSGEPLEGIQIMGVLETRSLDFSNIIICAVNEDVFPAGKLPQSIIPFSVKRAFTIPLYKEKDAIFAYHFYRLLSRANNISILYNADEEGLNSYEKSRFIRQLEYELPQKNKNALLQKEQISIPARLTSNAFHGIQQNAFSLLQLDKKLEKGVSPSMLSTFIRCPEDFYYKYILQLNEESEVEENIEDHALGTLLHSTLEKLYQPYLKKKLTDQALTDMRKKVLKTLQEIAHESFGKAYFESGKNLLAFEICKKYLLNFFQAENDRISTSIQVEALEENMRYTCRLSSHLPDITFKGIADKVEKLADGIHIIDYKTGSVHEKDLIFGNMDELFSSDKKRKALQLFFYTWLYKRCFAEEQAVYAGICSLRKPASGVLYLNDKKPISNDDLLFFEEKLAELFIRMRSPEMHYVHQPDATFCLMCT